WTVTIDFVEIAILRDAVGPKIELFDQPQMCGEMHGGPEIEYVRDAIGVGYSGAEKRTGGCAGDQAIKGFVQRCARSCGAVGERSDYVYSLEVIASQADALGRCGSANPLIPRVVE